MAVVRLKPGGTAIDVSFRNKLSPNPKEMASAPGGLYPMRASAWEMDEYRIMAGWPVEVPSYDIRINTLVSATGEVLVSRESPTSLTTGAAVRWIADPNFYDQTALRWTPVQGDLPVWWETSVAAAPVLLGNYEYRVGDERFTDLWTLNFDSDTANYMWTDLSSTFGGSNGYTVILVMNPNSAYGNDVSVPYNGLWCPKDDPDSWFSYTMQGNYLYQETEAHPREMGVAIADQLSTSSPTYIALVLQRPVATMYVGSGPSKLLSKQIPTGADQALTNNEVYLGRSAEDELHTADMALFEIGIYGDALSAKEVADEIAILSQAYGGNS